MPCLRLLLLVCVVVFAIPQVGAATPSAQAHTTDEYIVYVPLVFRPPPSMQGQVNLNGVPVAGVEVQLVENIQGEIELVQLLTTTDASGQYVFTEVPELVAGNTFFIAYNNEERALGRLRSWQTAPIRQFKQGETFTWPTFDIADVPLVAPAGAASVEMPAEFRWQKRVASPTDKYRLAFLSSTVGVTQQVAYDQESVTCPCETTPPVTFSAGGAFFWSVVIEAPDGGRGETVKREVAFASSAP